MSKFNLERSGTSSPVTPLPNPDNLNPVSYGLNFPNHDDKGISEIGYPHPYPPFPPVPPSSEQDRSFLDHKNYAKGNNYDIRTYFDNNDEGNDAILDKEEFKEFLISMDSDGQFGCYDKLLSAMFDDGQIYKTGASAVKALEDYIRQINPYAVDDLKNITGKNRYSISLDELNFIKRLGKSGNPDTENVVSKFETPSKPSYEGINNLGQYVHKPKEKDAYWDSGWKEWRFSGNVYPAVQPSDHHVTSGYDATIKRLKEGKIDGLPLTTGVLTIPSGPNYEGINNLGQYVPKPQEKDAYWDSNWKEWRFSGNVYATDMPPADHVKQSEYDKTIALIEKGKKTGNYDGLPLSF